MKEAYYFPHDYNARHDEKIINLISKKDAEGYGYFWMIIEMMYEAGGALRLNYDCIAFALRTSCEIVKSIIHDFGLFEIDGDTFTSKRVQNNLKLRIDKQEKARNSAFKRWDAKAMPTQCKGNAIKERKGKERKRKEILKGKDSEKAVSASEIKFTLPEWIPKETWDAFIEVRKAKKCPNTERALKMLIKKLYKFKIQGIDIKEAIECSIVNGWKDVYEPRKGEFIQGRNKQEQLQDKNIAVMKNWLDKKMEVLE